MRPTASSTGTCSASPRNASRGGSATYRYEVEVRSTTRTEIGGEQPSEVVDEVTLAVEHEIDYFMKNSFGRARSERRRTVRCRRYV